MRKFLSSLFIVITTISFTFSSNALQIDEKINEVAKKQIEEDNAAALARRRAIQASMKRSEST